MIWKLPLRAALAAFALLAVTGCSKDADFTLTANYTVATSGSAYGPTVQNFDLAAEAGSAWKYRDRLKSVKLVGATAVASNVTPATRTGSGKIWLRFKGDHLIGEWNNVAIKNGTLLSIDGNSDIDSALDEALHTDGQVAVVLQGNADGDFTANVEVQLHVQVEYKVKFP